MTICSLYLGRSLGNVTLIKGSLQSFRYNTVSSKPCEFQRCFHQVKTSIDTGFIECTIKERMQ